MLPLFDGFFRWTAGQQATFTATLGEVVEQAGTDRDTPTVMQATRQLAALPDPVNADVETCQALLASHDPVEEVVRQLARFLPSDPAGLTPVRELLEQTWRAAGSNLPPRPPRPSP